MKSYRPISVLPCFSKIPERIICNRFHKYFLENKILDPRQFGFQVGHSTDHAISQVGNQIFETWERVYTFERVDRVILLKKLELYGIRLNNHNWIKSYLSNRKRYIEIEPTTKTSLEQVIPQGSEVAHLLFLLYVNYGSWNAAKIKIHMIWKYIFIQPKQICIQ